MIGRGARPFPGKDQFIVLDHGGNIERLGFYEDEIEWSLDGKKLGYRKKVKKDKQKKALTCSVCDYIFFGSACPQCGTRIKDYGKKIEAMDAELVKLKKTDRKYTMDDKRRWWGMLRYYCQEKGYSEGWAVT